MKLPPSQVTRAMLLYALATIAGLAICFSLGGCGLFHQRPVQTDVVRNTVTGAIGKHPIPPPPAEYDNFSNWLIVFILGSIILLGVSIALKSTPLGLAAAGVGGTSLFLRTTLWIMPYIGAVIMLGVLVYLFAKIKQRHELGVKLFGGVQPIPKGIVTNANNVKQLIDRIQNSPSVLTPDDQKALNEAQASADAQAQNATVIEKIAPKAA